jgi:hypothetical protein
MGSVWPLLSLLSHFLSHLLSVLLQSSSWPEKILEFSYKKGVFMKIIFAFALLSSVALAQAASVKVTSFNYIRTSNSFTTLAELCGHVDGATSAPSFVKVHVDPRTNNPGTYNTMAGKDGKFCVVVNTFRGTAEVSLLDAEGSVATQAK